jgi:hypothetical protein
MNTLSRSQHFALSSIVVVVAIAAGCSPPPLSSSLPVGTRLYGVAEFGGTQCSPSGCGTVFTI